MVEEKPRGKHRSKLEMAATEVDSGADTLAPANADTLAPANADTLAPANADTLAPANVATPPAPAMAATQPAPAEVVPRAAAASARAPGCPDKAGNAETQAGAACSETRAGAAHSDTLAALEHSLEQGVRAAAQTQVGSADTLHSRGALETASAAAPAQFAEGAKIDRFIVIDKLGEGGMGVVLAAYDPLLDRKVAIKLLRPRSHAGRGQELAVQRLLREARAMAKLSHPNVLPVFDAGMVGDRVYIAMEFVDGETLGQWLAGGERSWKEVIDVYLLAARGLAAAHHADLVHRDFKPQNCLIGQDGRVWVTDFGLVSPNATSDSLDASLEAARSDSIRSVPLDASLTHTGEVMGTPIYMAPEQHRGQPTDARADQFSFCVALYEALLGERPFAGDSYVELAHHVTEGERAPVAEGKAVPARILRALDRGLEVDRAHRYPSMDELLADLAHPAPPRRGRFAIAIVAFAAVAGMAVYAQRSGARGKSCVLDGGRFTGTWDQGARARLRVAFAATGRADAGSTFELVAARLDRYRHSWKRQWTLTCEANQRGEQSSDALDLRMRCLERRRLELGAVVAVLTAEASAETLDKSVPAVAGLPGFARCADLEALRAAYPPPQDGAVGAQIDALETQVDAAQMLERMGRYEQGLAQATALVEQARGFDYPPLLARTLLLRGLLLQRTGDLKQSEELVREAITTAVAANDAELEARSWIWLIWNLSAQAHYQRALEAGEVARSAIARAGASGLLEARLANRLGLLAQKQGDFAAAVVHLEAARSLFERALGADDPNAAFALANLGFTAVATGDYPRAGEYFARALANFETTLGPTHPHVASVLQGLGVVAKAKGDYGEALAYLQRTLDIREQLLGNEHSQVADVVNSMGNVATLQGQHDAARRYYQRALDIYEKAHGPEHPRVGLALYGLGSVAEALGEYGQARDYLERALAIDEKANGPDHPDVANSLTTLALVLRRLEDCQSAGKLLRRALAIQEKHFGPDHPALTGALTAAGACLVELGEPGRALPILERTLRIREKHTDKVALHKIAESRFTLARALWAARRDRKRAAGLARSAREVFAAGGEGQALRLEEIRGWMSARGLR